MAMKYDKQNSSGRQGFAKNHGLASEAGRKGGQSSHGGGGVASGGHATGGQQGNQLWQPDVGSGQPNDSDNSAIDRRKASEAGKKGGQHS